MVGSDVEKFLKMCTYTIKFRKQRLINTDPQRRCYNGCHFSSELQWTPLETLESNISEDRIDQRMKFWSELNDYAVSQRGEAARHEIRVDKEIL
jgi:hypothetical protein